MGDPAGIGPEVVARALASEPRRALVIGDPAILARAVRIVGSDQPIRVVPDPGAVGDEPGVLHVLAASALPDDLPFGALSAACGRAAYAYVELGARLAQHGDVRALVTAPINKEALRLAGIAHPGHTEVLADLAGVDRVAMLLATPELRVVLATIHLALRDALAALDADLELATIRLADEAGRRLGYERPRIAVAGVNPHAGEHGLFGDEETRIVAPAIAGARALGIDASGPWPPDTVFMRARAGDFDLVVAQYHDQGLIPIKLLGLDEGVNVTVGLPYVRTSVDHGTAFDIAGTGRASGASMLAALRLAERLTARR
jgi:4-hydroxythreonine-4-phosphate dehydrogenase